jgi:hypothetical protein
MSKQLLIENFTAAESRISESRDGHKNLFLAGRIMTAEERNLNGRVYPKKEIQSAVDKINGRIKLGESVLGELNHPDGLSINLANVSHVITEAFMDGNYAIGKCKVLNTPAGMIVQNLIEGGVRLGVSSRGTGDVNGSGIVEGFQFVAMDIVANPSGPGCYPDVVREAQETQKLLTLAEAVIHDKKAQKYFEAEISKFISAITGK